ncbi:MAG TPA: YlbF family regulator [Pelolinea sp.]|nr:YlbF family regulator [Pelolinea sp.]
MITKNNIETEISTELEISAAIRDFTNALVETAHYKNYESASEKFHGDEDAKRALQEYQARANELNTKQMFNMISEAEQQDLQRLWMIFLGFKSVQDFLDAQGEFQALCRDCAQVISDNCGLDYATSCGSGCCG